MKYFSIDIETTGLNKYKHQVLQIGIVYEDTDKKIPVDDLPYKEFFVKHNNLQFSEHALKMHTESGLLDEYLAIEKMYIENIVEELCNWFEELGVEQNETNGKFEIVVAGKNFNAFDRQFLHEFYAWDMSIHEHRRVLDPAIFYIDWMEDKTPPNLSTCLRRAGFEYDVEHDAIEDARDVIRLIRATRDPVIYNKAWDDV